MKINVQSHPIFHRDGHNIVINQEVNFSEVLLGASIKIPTLNGHKAVKIPPGTKSHAKLRLKGLGVPDKGDLLVRVIVKIPKELTADQENLAKKLKDAGL